MAASLGQYLAAGNTLPGGFAGGDASARGGFLNSTITPRNPPPAADTPPTGPARQRTFSHYDQPAQYAGTGQAAPFMGAETTKLYLSFVNDIVAKHQAELSDEIGPEGYPRPPTGEAARRFDNQVGERLGERLQRKHGHAAAAQSMGLASSTDADEVAATAAAPVALPSRTANLAPSAAAPAAPTGPVKWEISEDMMHQKWGSVLRTLQPGSTKLNNNVPPPTRPAQAPAYVSGKSYATGALPPTASSTTRYGLSARPSLQ